jgi:hypothetical protein
MPTNQSMPTARPLKYPLSAPTLTGDINQTLSNLLSQTDNLKKRINDLQGTVSRIQTTISPSSSSNPNVFLGAFSTRVSYVPGNQVTFNGSYYICIQATTGHIPTVTLFWQLVGSPNSVQFMGVYSNTTSYVAGNQVELNGLFFICTAPTTGNAPPNTTYWQQITTAISIGGGASVVSGVTKVTNVITSPVSGQTFTGPGWIVGQVYMGGTSIDIFVPNSGGNTGYMFNFDFRNGNPISTIYSVSNVTVPTRTSLASGPVNSASGTGWLNFAIYISCTGFMAVWINGAISCEVTDITYSLPTTAITMQYGADNVFISSTKIGPVANASGLGSSALNGQGSISTVSDYQFSYVSSTSTIEWSWSAFNVYCPDGSSYAVAASTGTATTLSGASGTQTGTAPMEWTGLSASTTYYFEHFITLNPNGTGTVNINCAATAISSLSVAVQVIQGDGNTACAAGVDVTAATTASGSGGGVGGGGAPKRII